MQLGPSIYIIIVTGDFWLFLQERVLGLPSKPGTKRNPSGSLHFAGIQRVYDEQ